MKIRVLSILLTGVMVGCFSLAVQADDMIISGLEFSSIGPGAVQEEGHYDADPWKGFANISVTNTGTEAWGDFHFSITGVGAGSG